MIQWQFNKFVIKKTSDEQQDFEKSKAFENVKFFNKW